MATYYTIKANREIMADDGHWYTPAIHVSVLGGYDRSKRGYTKQAVWGWMGWHDGDCGTVCYDTTPDRAICEGIVRKIAESERGLCNMDGIETVEDFVRLMTVGLPKD